MQTVKKLIGYTSLILLVSVMGFAIYQNNFANAETKTEVDFVLEQLQKGYDEAYEAQQNAHRITEKAILDEKQKNIGFCKAERSLASYKDSIGFYSPTPAPVIKEKARQDCDF